MAITNAQQYQQLVNPPMKGNKRPGYRGDDAARSSEGTSAGRADPGQGAPRGDGPAKGAPNQDRIADIRQANITLENLRQDKIEEKLEKFRDLNSPSRKFSSFLSKFSPLARITSKFSPLNNKDFFTDKVLGSKNFSNITRDDFANLTEDEKENMFGDYMSSRMSGETDAYGNQIGDRGGESSNILLPQGIMAQAPGNTDQETEEEDEIVNYRLMNKGGRVGLFKGAQADANAGKGAMSPGTDTGGGFRGGNGDGPKEPPTLDKSPNLIEKFPSTIRAIDKMNLDKMIANMNLNTVTEEDDEDTNAIDTVFSPDIASNLQTVYGTGLTNRQQIEKNILNSMADGGRAGLAEGGMPYEGGIMDLESARQMYGLGKLVKKITRGVKKVAKSPIGKAALAFGAYKLGGGFLKDKGIMGKLFGLPGVDEFGGTPGFLNKLRLTKGFGSMMPTALGGIAATTLGSYFLTPEEEKEQELASYGADIKDPRFIMANNRDFTNTRLLAEGGSTEEPVAKKTMPLLDMDGKEMDLRAEGGFVPIGRMEKADDVPARLSKNEFVFTADAVRNAGEGDVDKGAEVMYNMMKNLESGGEVSEESQGLEGARDMFQTSQRLEEVI